MSCLLHACPALQPPLSFPGCCCWCCFYFLSKQAVKMWTAEGRVEIMLTVRKGTHPSPIRLWARGPGECWNNYGSCTPLQDSSRACHDKLGVLKLASSRRLAPLTRQAPGCSMCLLSDAARGACCCCDLKRATEDKQSYGAHAAWNGVKDPLPTSPLPNTKTSGAGVSLPYFAWGLHNKVASLYHSDLPISLQL